MGRVGLTPGRLLGSGGNARSSNGGRSHRSRTQLGRVAVGGQAGTDATATSVGRRRAQLDRGGGTFVGRFQVVLFVHHFGVLGGDVIWKRVGEDLGMLEADQKVALNILP